MVLFQGDKIGIGMLIAYSGVVAFFPVLRYVIGLKHWKDYTVVSMGLSIYMWLNYYKYWWVGLITWIGAFLIIQGAMVVSRRFLRKENLHFFAKLAIATQVGTWTFIAYVSILYALLHINLLTSIYIIVSGILLLASAETLTYLYLKKGKLEALRRGTISLLAAVMVGILFRWRSLLILFYEHQELLMVFLGITILVSTWRYLNISDWVRFYPIAKSNKKD